MGFVFPPFDAPGIPVKGINDGYPVNRIFCVGRNYAAHAAEMGSEVDREAPWYFTKFASCYTPNGATIPYPPGTRDFHHEIELVLALGKQARNISVDEAQEAIYGFACGIDFTRRDMQQVAKDHRRPWDTGKNFKNAALIGDITRSDEFGQIADQLIHLEVNGKARQSGKLSDMIWSSAEIISHLSSLEPICPGDLIMTGTPAGVGPAIAGDKITGGIAGLEPLSIEIGPPEA